MPKPKQFVVVLTEAERAQLGAFTTKGIAAAREVRRARILLLAAEGRPDAVVADAVGCCVGTVARVRRRCAEAGVEAALQDRPRPGAASLLDGKGEAFLVALACTDPPAGQSAWTMQLLAERLVALDIVDHISDETVRRTLKKNALKPWQRQEWCLPDVSAAFIWRMEDVLDLYAEPYDPARPVVCLDERPVVLRDDVRPPWPPAPGRPRRRDSEYARCGTACLAVLFEPQRGWRHIIPSQRRTKRDFAGWLKDVVDVHYPQAQTIRLVVDNLNTHTPAVLYEVFPPAEAHRLARKLEFHYTPKHGSWLNMVEIELSVLASTCLDRRLPDLATLARETTAYAQQRNAAQATVQWRFTTPAARTKLTHLYPTLDPS